MKFCSSKAHSNLSLTYESGEKAHGNHEVNRVVAVVVTVDLQRGEGAEQEGDLDEVVPGGEGLEPGDDLVDALAELHVVGVVVGGVVDRGVGPLERGLGAAVREGAAVIRDEGLRGVAAGKRLETEWNMRDFRAVSCREP